MLYASASRGLAPARRREVLCMAVVLLIGGAWAVAAEENKFHLKPGAQVKSCAECHPDFEETLKLPFVHSPVKAGTCSDCHSPHASDHGKLLAADVKQICTECHADIKPAEARSTHPPVATGDCAKCHDPHAAKNANNLPIAGNELCFSCHTEMKKSLAANTFKHAPVEKSCLTCHDPHSSAGSESLLKTAVPALCSTCHKAADPAFTKAHMGYNVAKSNCISCHDPHGSSSRGTLWTSVHQPVASKMCGQCHVEPTASGVIKLKKTGADLCRSCHVDMINETLAKPRIHWPVIDKTACTNCHNPHASKQKPLLKQPEAVLCGSCHRDAVKRQVKSVTPHPPVADGECSTCHSGHASNGVYLLASENVVDLCGTCHDWQRHSTHPIGAKVIDPRNKNLSLDCLSCHRSHGSAFKHLSYNDTKTDLCVQCHEQLKR